MHKCHIIRNIIILYSENIIIIIIIIIKQLTIVMIRTSYMSRNEVIVELYLIFTCQLIFSIRHPLLFRHQFPTIVDNTNAFIGATSMLNITYILFRNRFKI